MRRWWNARGVLTRVALVAAFVAIFFDGAFPYLAQFAVGSPNPLPVPRTLRLWYYILVGAALAIYLISSESTLADFMAPIKRAASREATLAERLVFRGSLGLFPAAVAIAVFMGFVPRAELPAATRQQHPGMGSAGAAPYAGKLNPLRPPGAPDLAAFRAAYAALPGPEDDYDSRPPKADPGALTPAAAKELFLSALVDEGRAVYFKNCAPCHGAKFDGDGPASRAWSLRPIDFHDGGTIATLVEDAVFWRVNEGGAGLPPVATPWDSVMPAWKSDLTEKEMWQVIATEYHDAGVKPRVLEFRLQESESRAKEGH